MAYLLLAFDDFEQVVLERQGLDAGHLGHLFVAGAEAQLLELQRELAVNLRGCHGKGTSTEAVSVIGVFDEPRSETPSPESSAS